MDNLTLKFQTVYILITPGRLAITRQDPRPITNDQVPYVLIVVKITPDGDNMSITGIYVYGVEDNQRIRWRIQNINLKKILGHNILKQLQKILMSLSRTTIDNLLNSNSKLLNGLLAMLPTDQSFTAGSSSQTNFSYSIPGGTEFEQFLTFFTAALGAYISLFEVINQNQDKIGRPFFPLLINLPETCLNCEERLTSSFARYISYYTRMSNAISLGLNRVEQVGPTWLAFIDLLWSNLAAVFPVGNLVNPELSIYDTMVGYSYYAETRIEKLVNLISQIDPQLSDYVTRAGQEYAIYLDNLSTNSSTQSEFIVTQGDKYLSTLQELSSQLLAEFENIKSTGLESINQELTAALESLTNLQQNNTSELTRQTESGVDQLYAARENMVQYMLKTRDTVAAELQRIEENILQVARNLEANVTERINGVVETMRLSELNTASNTQISLTNLVDKLKLLKSDHVSELNSIKNNIDLSIQDSIRSVTGTINDEFQEMLHEDKVQRDQFMLSYTEMHNEGIELNRQMRADLERKLTKIVTDNEDRIDYKIADCSNNMEKLEKSLTELVEGSYNDLHDLHRELAKRMNCDVEHCLTEINNRKIHIMNEVKSGMKNLILEIKQPLINDVVGGMKIDTDEMVQDSVRRHTADYEARQNDKVAELETMMAQMTRLELKMDNTLQFLRNVQSRAGPDMNSILERLDKLERENCDLKERCSSILDSDKWLATGSRNNNNFSGLDSLDNTSDSIDSDIFKISERTKKGRNKSGQSSDIISLDRIISWTDEEKPGQKRNKSLWEESNWKR